MSAQELLPVMGKKYSTEILVATAEPRSAQELSDELGIPIATCYRRIEELVEEGLLEHHGTQVSENNRSVEVYVRSVDDVYVDFGETLSVSTGEQSSKKAIDNIWRKLRGISDGLK